MLMMTASHQFPIYLDRIASSPRVWTPLSSSGNSPMRNNNLKMMNRSNKKSAKINP